MSYSKTSATPQIETALGKQGTKTPPPYMPEGLKRASLFLLVFGVIIPAAAIAVEATTHICAKNFFDPIPTWNHVALVSLVPLTNFMYWLSTRCNMTDHYAFMSLGNGMAMGVAILYSLMFLPMVPIAFAAMFICFWYGLVALAPLFSLPCTWFAGKGICKLSMHHGTYFDGHQLEHIGHLIILVTVVAIELPSTLTRMHLVDAADLNPTKSLPAVKWLRAFGNQEVMLRACYERSGRATDVIGSLYEATHKITVDEARSIFYKVTGKPFNSVPIPSSARATMLHADALSSNDLNAGVEDEFDFDPDIAGEMVSGVARGLSVKNSTISGTIDSEAALATLKWKLDFNNVSTVGREARAKILLPANAVVDGARIWVNGKERTATVMSRNAARSHYVSAVHSKQDPLLVSNAGIDQVLVQCYPINPNNNVSVELSLSAPLTMPAGKNEATLVMPAFAERNFQTEVPTKVSFTATNEIMMPGASITSDPQGKHAVAEVSAQDLSRFGAVISTKHTHHGFLDLHWQSVTGVNPGAQLTRVSDTAVSPHYGYVTPSQLRVVVDRSGSMKQYIEKVAEGLQSLPSDLPVSITLVGDERTTLCNAKAPSSPEFKQAIERLKDQSQCVGGQLDGEALVAQVRGLQPDQSILWIHAAQPKWVQNTRYLTSSATHRSQPFIYDMQVATGPDEILNGAKATDKIVRVSNVGDPAETLKTLIALWQSYKNHPDHGPQNTSLQISGNNVKIALELNTALLVHDSITSRVASYRTYAMQNARQVHIVTPMTSLVVVDPKLMAETIAQEKRNELCERKMRSVSFPNRIARIMPMAQQRQSTRDNDALSTPVLHTGERAPTNPPVILPPGTSYAQERSVIHSFRESARTGDEFASTEAQGASSKPAAAAPARQLMYAANAPVIITSGTAPVDRRFGQSNEVAMMQDASEYKKKDAESLPGGYSLSAASRMKVANDNLEADQLGSDEEVDSGAAASSQSLGMEGLPGQLDELNAKPTPEPETYLMLGVLAFMLGFAVLTRRKPLGQKT